MKLKTHSPLVAEGKGRCHFTLLFTWKPVKKKHLALSQENLETSLRDPQVLFLEAGTAGCELWISSPPLAFIGFKPREQWRPTYCMSEYFKIIKQAN